MRYVLARDPEFAPEDTPRATRWWEPFDRPDGSRYEGSEQVVAVVGEYDDLEHAVVHWGAGTVLLRWDPEVEGRLVGVTTEAYRAACALSGAALTCPHCGERLLQA